ncbi:MAG: ATP-binding protein [Christensenellaceae bacterium]|jgi:hypothetical protein|nr:ATP-binding protein [Christensenellaceae bacterium]
MADGESKPKKITSYIIPRNTRIKTQFLWGLTGNDIVWLVFGAGFAAAFLFSNIHWAIQVIGILLVAAIFIGGFVKGQDGERVFGSYFSYFKFIGYVKKYAKIPGFGYKDVHALSAYTGIKEGKYIKFEGYLGAVIEIKPIEFGLLDQENQNMVVNCFANALRRLSGHATASIVKLEKKLILDKFIKTEEQKYANLVMQVQNGGFNNAEISAREPIFEERASFLEYLNEETNVPDVAFYFVIYENDGERLDQAVEGVMRSLRSGAVPLENQQITGRDLYIFMRGMYDSDFNERKLDELVSEDKKLLWTLPGNVKFGIKSNKVNNKARAEFAIMDYPTDVRNAWGNELFNYPGANVVMNIAPVSREESVKMIDKAIVEIRSRTGNSKKESKIMDSQAELDTIYHLLMEIKQANELMYNVNWFFSSPLKESRELAARIKENDFKYSALAGKQIDGFLSRSLGRYNAFEKSARGIPTSALAAVFPFISDKVQDPQGIFIGSNTSPVFVDFFRRDNMRVNSNMIVIGKSGSGKSFATKMMLTNLAADNARVFICDPEKEYTNLAKNLAGQSIDVGNAGAGRFNPFHVYPAMVDEDAEGAEFDDTFESHLRFLESFFKTVMEGIKQDALETLNSLVVNLYKMKGIDKWVDFAQLKPTDFPTFDELYKLAVYSHERADDEYSAINYRILMTYLEKFSDGGRYSGLWNGPATIDASENFVVFNFMTLLSNKNTVVANAQMLLVFKYLDGEIIKNREYNRRYKTKRKIVIVVDEAHVFIDESKPVALDFMFNMAKRIRKYDGMQIVITQNIKDFVGSPAIAKKSAAIINASQYSMVFSLAPNDMTDLITLYKNSGGINKTEQDQIVSAQRGQAFFIYSPSNRTTVQIDSNDVFRSIFE